MVHPTSQLSLPLALPQSLPHTSSPTYTFLFRSLWPGYQVQLCRSFFWFFSPFEISSLFFISVSKIKWDQNLSFIFQYKRESAHFSQPSFIHPLREQLLIWRQIRPVGKSRPVRLQIPLRGFSISSFVLFSTISCGPSIMVKRYVKCFMDSNYSTTNLYYFWTQASNQDAYWLRTTPSNTMLKIRAVFKLINRRTVYCIQYFGLNI